MPRAGRCDHRLPGGNAPRSRLHAFRGASGHLPGVPGVSRADEGPGSAHGETDPQIARAGNRRLTLGRIPPLERLPDRAVTSGASRGLHLHPTPSSMGHDKGGCRCKTMVFVGSGVHGGPDMRVTSMTHRGSTLLLTSILLALAVLLLAIAWHGPSPAKADDKPSAANGLGQLSGLLPRNNLVLESALQVDLTQDTVRLPLYKGTANGQTVWFILTEASDAGLAKNSGLNYAPKLANIAISCAACVQTVTLDSPSADANKFGPAVVHFLGEPDFSLTRTFVPGPNGFPPASFSPGAVAGPGYSPFIRIDASAIVYNAPIVATGDGPFDVTTHTNTGDRVLGIHIAPASPPGQFLESWVDMLLVKGFDAGQHILYLSTEVGGDQGAAVLERSTYVPALANAPYNGGDDFLGSSRERLFAFINGQTGADNKQSQGFRHLILDGHAAEDASADNTALINALRNGGDLLNVFGDFPTFTDPRHAQAYSPLWEAQIGQWTDKAVQQGLNTRQIDENVVFNLADTRPDLLTGPGGGAYGAQGVVINCAVIGFTNKPPTANLVDPAPNSQFPPR